METEHSPQCKEVMKAPQSAYALRCAGCSFAITPASVHDDGEGESVDLADEDEKQAPKRQKVESHSYCHGGTSETEAAFNGAATAMAVVEAVASDVSYFK
jgi:hypothetical protein